MSNRLLTRAEVDHWMKTGERPADCVQTPTNEVLSQSSAITPAAEHQRALNAMNSEWIEKSLHLKSQEIDAFSPKGQEMLKTHYAYVAGTRCPLMPSTPHCWHEQLELWSDLFPPALVCCWCDAKNDDVAAVPHRHGPYVPKG